MIGRTVTSITVLVAHGLLNHFKGTDARSQPAALGPLAVDSHDYENVYDSYANARNVLDYQIHRAMHRLWPAASGRCHT